MAPTYSGQKAVTAAGTAETLVASDTLYQGPVMIKALPANTGVMYVGQVTGDVSSSNGMPLSAGDALIMFDVGNLKNIWVDASVSGEGVAWLLLEL